MTNHLFTGIDVGSTTTKIVFLEHGRLIAYEIAPTGADSRRTVDALLAAALGHCGRRRDEIAAAVSTGYGRRRVEFASRNISEITANALGVRMLLENAQQPRTVIDIGGQDSKVIALDDDGILRDFAMNDKCAAGTGRFLEVMARTMEVELCELGGLSLQASGVLPINSLCTVFAESEVISLLAHGEDISNIIAGMHASVAKRVGALVRKVGVREPACFTGGPALNAGLHAALERELGVRLAIPTHPQLAAACGAAMLASEERL